MHSEVNDVYSTVGQDVDETRYCVAKPPVEWVQLPSQPRWVQLPSVHVDASVSSSFLLFPVRRRFTS